ncbi:MAG: PEP-CTERM sorting domain-containing protein [Chthonomonas sp.]|nr:PEP-CTERM sorting domain-containing protein [Chthonomonas sp.]
MRRLVLTSLATALGSVAFASFDLFIMPDSVSGNHARYDPINRVSLGTVNVASNNSVVATNGRPYGYYRYASGSVAAVNNYTGERLSGFQSINGGMSMSSDGTRVGLTAGNTFVIMNSSSAILTTVATFGAPAGFVAHGSISVSGGRWVVYGLSSAGNLDLYLVSGAGAQIGSLLNVVSSTSLTSVGTGGLGQGAVFMRQSVERFVIPYRDNTGAHRLVTNTVLFGSTAFQTLSGYSVANVGTTLATVAGHQGFFVVGADQTTSTLTRIQEMDDLQTFVPLQNYTTNSMSAPVGTQWRMANIVAPEPGTMAALGLGVLALLKRRKK